MKVGYKKSALGEIPVDWEVVRIGDVLNNIKGGGTPSKDIPEYWKSEIPWATVKDLKKLILNDTIDYISKIGLENSASNLIPAWTLIISTRMAVGKAVFVTKDVSINQDLKALFPKDNLDKFFLFHWFFFNSDNILNLASGSTVKGIRLEVLKGLTLAIPPLKEQQKIAEILSTVDAKISIIDAQISETQNLKKGLMQSLLSKGIGHTEFKKSALGEIPKSWEVVELGEIEIELIDGDRGHNYPKSKDFSNQGYCLFLSAKNVTKNGFKFNECQFISKERDNLLRKGKLLKYDFIITTRGSVGHVAVFDDSVSYEQIRLNSGMVILRDTKNNYNTQFLHQLLKSSFFHSQIKLITSGSAQPQLTVKALKKLKLLLAPLKEQQKIASILNSVDEKLGVLSEKKSYYQNLKKGLMQQLLTGLVRVSV